MIIIKQITCIPLKKSDPIFDEHLGSVKIIENLNDNNIKLNIKQDDSDNDDDDSKENISKINSVQKFKHRQHQDLELLSD
jgi:hypothetical protein